MKFIEYVQFIFKRRSVETDREEIPSSPDQLKTEYEISLDEYKKQVEAKWTFHPAEYGDATNVSTIRDHLHLLIVKMRENNVEFDESQLKELDQIWQKWCLERIRKDFGNGERYPLSPSRDPKDHWWWWIDRLDELTDEQRGTI